METMLIKEQYKVVRALDVREDYAFLETVDIKDREKSACLLNLYEGNLLPVYLDVFDRLKGCPGYRGAFIADGSLAAVFEHTEGTSIDQVFYRGAKIGWQTRLEFAELLLHSALSMANDPPEVSCAAMLSENVLTDLTGGRLRFRRKILPMEGMNSRELVYLTVDQLEKILIRRFESPLVELEFLQRLADGECRSVVRLYALWREYKDAIAAAYEANEKKNILKRWISNLWNCVKWKWNERKRGEGL